MNHYGAARERKMARSRDAKSTEPEIILVICVDKDDDVGSKTKVRTPIIGRENVFQAAVRLISEDPAEADANVMFESIKILDNLLSEETGQFEIAVVAGSSNGDVKANRKISKEIQEVVEKTRAKSAILVSDGFSDQEVAPIIESHIRIVSVHRFAVKHSQVLETTWFVLVKYIQELLKEPRNARWLFGIPGLSVLILAALSIISLQYPNLPLMFLAAISLAVIVGGTLVVKGFSIDAMVGSAISEVVDHPSVLTNVFATITGVVVCILGFQQGLSAAIASQSSMEFNSVVAFLKISTGYVAFGGAVILIGRATYYFFERSIKFWSNCMGVVVIVMLGVTVYFATEIDNIGYTNFFIVITVSIVAMFLNTLLFGRLKKRYAKVLH